MQKFILTDPRDILYGEMWLYNELYLLSAAVLNRSNALSNDTNIFLENDNIVSKSVRQTFGKWYGC